MVLECLCRQELSSLFTFKDDASSTRERKKMEVILKLEGSGTSSIFQVIMMPPFIAPKTEVKVTNISTFTPFPLKLFSDHTTFKKCGGEAEQILPLLR